MLYETFNSIKDSFGQDYFTSRISDEIIQNLSPNFKLRDYQKEALGRFDFYFKEYKKRQLPTHLLFWMATGSGKTLIMAANILYLYKLGYRNFIFFVNSVNIIEKTRDNFLNPLSEKYLFAPKIKFGEKEVFIKEVQNFEGVNPENINIIFTTIQGLHTRLNNPKENSLTEEDFEGKDIVLISDEAHHLQTLTKTNKEEIEIERSWEYTIINKIFKKNLKNILLEFTATIDLSNENIKNKYEDKIIFKYDLKQFRLDKYSKEIEVLEADLDPIERGLQAVILSQYRRKIAEKYKVYLKPVILFKSKSIKESEKNYENFLLKIKNLKQKDIKDIKKRAKGTILEKVFDYFEEEKISFDNLIEELKIDFSKEKVMLLDSENINEEKQLKLNSLESRNNEIRAIFAVNMLNEGWDVLNLFDIVRLYETRDGKWVGDKYKPGNTTLGEAQLIGRGARYFPFQLDETQDKYKRKFDDTDNELKILETLYYHCFKEPKYIAEIKATLRDIGILEEKEIKEMRIKEEFKETDFWKNGIIFINKQMKNPRTTINGFKDIKIETNYEYELKTGELKEESILGEEKIFKSIEVAKSIEKYKLIDFGKNLIRGVLDKIEFYKFDNLKTYFPNLKSIVEFITSNNYLGNVSVNIKGPIDKIKNLNLEDKTDIVFNILTLVENQIKENTSNYIGTKDFEAKLLREIFKDKKIIKIDKDDEKLKEMKKIDLSQKDWYAYDTFYGTSEEQEFIEFMDNFIEKLKGKYKEIALLRNEKFFKIYNFDDGNAFEPDFILLLKKKNGKILIYQIFIEAKGGWAYDINQGFEQSKEGWKQEFLLKIEKDGKLNLSFEDKNFKIIGLPFYNKKLENDFRKVFEEKILK
jgi:type III restriction enzyme